MTRGRKPSVNYEKRHDWLIRNRQGETPPSIAKADGYDVRTIRINIELARHEAEAGEARTLAFRDALEKHQADLCTLAAKLDSAVTAEEDVSEILKERIAKALRQHLPSSRIWKDFDNWNNLLQERQNLREDLTHHIEKVIDSDTEIKESFPNRDALTKGIGQALVFQANQWAKGATGLSIERDIHLETTGEGVIMGRYGAFHLGPLTDKEVFPVRGIVQRLESELVDWLHYKKLQKAEDEIRILKDDLQDALAVIIMKRIVVGSCRYCPD